MQAHTHIHVYMHVISIYTPTPMCLYKHTQIVTTLSAAVPLGIEWSVVRPSRVSNAIYPVL